MMISREALFHNWKKMMFPLSFVLSSVVNIIFYYLGLALKENPAREYGFMLFCIVFALCCGLSFLYVLKTERFKWQTWILLGGVVAFFVVYFGIGLINGGLNSYIFSYLQKFIVFSVPAFIAGVCAAKWGVQDFTLTLEKLSFIVFPAAVMYFNQVLFDANPFNYGHDFGIIHYMSFAYTLMPFLLAHIIRFVDGADFEIPLKNQKIRHPQIIRGAMILINWVAIYSSGTRGTVVCVVVFCILLIAYKATHRLKIKNTMIVVGIMLAVLLFNMFVYAPSGMRWLGRMDMFLEGLAEGKIVTAVGDESVEADIDNLVLGDTGALPDKSSPEAQMPSAGDAALETPDVQTEVNPEQIRNRGTLYKIALKEFLKSPVNGMGPGEYSEKYGKYPHNAILELLAETGLVGTLLMFGFILIVLKKMLIDGWNDSNIQHLLLFIVAYAVYANISGTVWDCRALLGALGFGLAYQPEKRVKPIKATH